VAAAKEAAADQDLERREVEEEELRKRGRRRDIGVLEKWRRRILDIGGVEEEWRRRSPEIG
jgi:hypothetical protein